MKPITFLLFIFFTASLFAQVDSNDIPHQFEMIKKVETSSVKSQDKTNTCWAFATTSFIETELIRMGKGELDLSEMFFVYNNYPLKAEKYLRYHGLSNFGEGGLAHDVMSTIKINGLVPDSFYAGKLVDSTKYNHSEMHGILESMLKSIVNQKSAVISTLWKPAFNSVLNVYLGELPTEFTFDEIEYTSKSFSEYLEFNPDDYVQFTSYTHIPFYEKSNLEIPDNWANEKYFNIPIDELIAVMNKSIDLGYSFVWDGDVGRDYFYKSGYAVIPESNLVDNDSVEIVEPEIEKKITQTMRQDSFNSFVTTDDHLMHITGIAKNQNGTKFYYTKNSWGTKKGFNGYWYMSGSYVRLMTVSIMVHKNVIPKEIKSKLKI
jgi:bleomycin hydrolase